MRSNKQLQCAHAQMFWILNIGISKCFYWNLNQSCKSWLKNSNPFWRYKQNTDCISTKWNAHPLLCSTCLTSLLNMFWVNQQELFFMSIPKNFLKKFPKKLQKKWLTASQLTEVEPYDECFPWNYWDHILMDFPE